MSIDVHGSAIQKTLQRITEACKAKEIQPLSISVHIDYNLNINMKGFPSSLLKNPSILSKKGSDSNLRK
jgi:hypothetical protein